MTDLGQNIPVDTGDGVDWSKQHAGVHQAPWGELARLMPDLLGVLSTFPKDPTQFTWDVKVHMLMPKMWPCIPNWHRDFAPRIGGIQHPELASDAELWMWLSGPPLTEFRGGFVRPRQWVKFSPKDEHRGTASGDFVWRGFIRAAPIEFLPPRDGGYLRRHSQVYLDAAEYMW